MRNIVPVVCLFGLSFFTRLAKADDDGDAASDDQALSTTARAHLLEGARAYGFGDYAAAERRFEQVARLAPRWYPIHYNRGVVAEARGHLGLAIRAYALYLPHAGSHEREALNARLRDLDRRRRDGLAMHRRQATLAGIVVGMGVAIMATGITLAVVGSRRGDDASRAMVGGGYGLSFLGPGVGLGAGIPLGVRAHRTRRRVARSPNADHRIAQIFPGLPRNSL
jgi:hypothetical protein